MQYKHIYVFFFLQIYLNFTTVIAQHQTPPYQYSSSVTT